MGTGAGVKGCSRSKRDPGNLEDRGRRSACCDRRAVQVAGWGIGGGTIAFGVADSVEGAQDIYYGSMGDIDSISINQLKDVILMKMLIIWQKTSLPLQPLHSSPSVRHL